MKKKVVHKMRVVEEKGQLVTLTTRCGITWFGLNEEHVKKMKEERMGSNIGEVTCRNCLRVLQAHT